MDRDRIGGGLLAASAAIGPVVAEMMGLSLSPEVGYPMLALCIVAAALGLWLLVRPKRSDKSTGATTVRARRGSNVELEDSYSEADTFLDAEESTIKGKRNFHRPGRGSSTPRTPL